MKAHSGSGTYALKCRSRSGYQDWMMTSLRGSWFPIFVGVFVELVMTQQYNWLEQTFSVCTGTCFRPYSRC